MSRTIDSGVSFGNPDLVAYAGSFGIPAFRPSSAADLFSCLSRALEVEGGDHDHARMDRVEA